MPIVILPRAKPHRPAGEGQIEYAPRCRDPDSLIKAGEAIEKAFEHLAAAVSHNAVKNAYLDMAAAYRRANRDVSRLWRDVNG
jgi:hypothetical protein